MQGLVKTLLGDVCSGFDTLLNERSMQLGLSTGVSAELENGWNVETKSRHDKYSNELRISRPSVLIASPPPIVLEVAEPR